MANIGTAPLDPTTAVGQLRSLLRDTAYGPLDPPIEGLGDYSVFSDADLEGALALSAGSALRAAARLTRGLALEYAASGKSIKTDDLAIDVRSRGADLLAVSDSFQDDAVAEEAQAASDYFNIVPYATVSGAGRQEGAVQSIW